MHYLVASGLNLNANFSLEYYTFDHTVKLFKFFLLKVLIVKRSQKLCHVHFSLI